MAGRLQRNLESRLNMVDLPGNSDILNVCSLYNSATGYGALSLEAECVADNAADSCSQHACLVEGYFVMNLLEVLLDPPTNDVVNEGFVHENGFDASLHCHGGHRGGGNNLANVPRDNTQACCGAYPQRFPFKTQLGRRACCNSTTYSTAILECCEDGEARRTC